MKETTFINQNKKKWAKFEKMSKTQQNDPDEMSRLFVELTDDLAYARTYYPKRSVRVYLNSLAQRVFHDLYKKKREPFSKFLTFWTKDLPLEMYRAQKSLLVAFVIFIIGMLIGIVSTIDNEDFLGAVIGYDYVQMAEGFIAEGKPMNVYGHGPESITFGQIAINNMRVAIVTFVLGIFFSLGSGIYLFFNSVMVGAFQWFYVVRNLTLASFLTIWIHGAFEIPAIILAAAAGITMGNGLLFPGTLTRMQSLIISAKRGIKMMIGIIPFILLAAFIEGYATRNTVITTHGEPIAGEWPAALKWLFILGCFAIVIFYFVIYPIIVARKTKFDGKVIEKPQYKEPNHINLYRIKDVGEIFTDTFMSYAKVFSTFFKLFLVTIVINVLYIIYLFEKIPFFEYQYEVTGNTFVVFARGEKILDNLEILFTWNQYFQWDLFIIQTLLFAFNAINIVYVFRRFISKNINDKFKDYIGLVAKSFIPFTVAFAIMGGITVAAPFALMLLLGLATPLLLMWSLPLALSKISIGKGLAEGFSMPWKFFWGGIGLFFSLLITLFIIYTFVGVPLDMFKDMVLEWFVLPIADEPQYIFTIIDASLYLSLCHLIFPIFIIGFSILYYSIKEQDEAVGMYKKLANFGTKSKIYESPDEGSF